MSETRREFLKGSAWMGTMALAAGCSAMRFCGTCGAPMQDFATRPLRRVRVGIVGLGNRGRGAVHRLAMVPGVDIVALCDVREEAVREQLSWLKAEGFPAPEKVFFGREDSWKDLCDSDLDVVYNVTPWALHVPIALYSMKAGKHALVEVPAAFAVDECWELIETSERTKRHCMQLENCCYGEMELLMLELCRKGLVGDILYGECSYIHDLRNSCWSDRTYRNWRLKWNVEHKGNQYPTHGLGPIAWCMDINRGDRFDYLTSLESAQGNFEAFARAHYGADDWRLRTKVAMGDMNCTLVKTALGRSILIKHDVSSPRPYTRTDLITGTKGVFWGMPWRTYGDDPAVFKMGFEERNGDGVHQFFDAPKAEEFRLRYRHPLWKKIGQIAEEVGGHGGMDFIMDLRWAYCLQNGLPLDQDVYDLAAWCSICELSERSVRNRSNSVDIPDFTRGAWRSAKKLGILDIDTSRLEFKHVRKDKDALNA